MRGRTADVPPAVAIYRDLSHAELRALRKHLEDVGGEAGAAKVSGPSSGRSVLLTVISVRGRSRSTPGTITSRASCRSFRMMAPGSASIAACQLPAAVGGDRIYKSPNAKMGERGRRAPGRCCQ